MGLKNHVIDWGRGPPREGALLREHVGPDMSAFRLVRLPLRANVPAAHAADVCIRGREG